MQSEQEEDREIVIVELSLVSNKLSYVLPSSCKAILSLVCSLAQQMLALNFPHWLHTYNEDYIHIMFNMVWIFFQDFYAMNIYIVIMIYVIYT